jgi:hypothetical protein
MSPELSQINCARFAGQDNLFERAEVEAILFKREFRDKNLGENGEERTRSAHRTV